MHLLLSAHRVRPADCLLGNLRRTHPLSRVLLYDADRIEEAASTEHETDLYERQCDVFLNPNDPAVIEEALKQGIPQNVIDAAQRSPVYKMAMDWKLALPLHPEYRTLPMVWYVPPLSPIQSYADAGGLPQSDGVLPAVESLRIPVQYRQTCSARAIPARCCAP